MFFVIYEIALHLLALFTLPIILYRFIAKKRYRKSFALRFGRGYPEIEKKGRFCVWVHAVSVGETKAVAPLVKILRESRPEALIIISSITETGHTEAQKSIPDADHFVYLPFDFNYVVKPIVKKVQPDLVILCETDFWANFQRESKRVGARLVLVNGKISEKSLRRHYILPWVSNHLFNDIDLFCVQSPLHKKRFEQAGVPSQKIIPTGNLKLDDVYPFMSDKDKLEWMERLGIQADDKVLVVGSTHSPEEKLILTSLEEVQAIHPTLKIILAPRHPERCSEVEDILKKKGLSYIPFTRIDEKKGGERVVLVDVIGQLRKCYQIADLAIVAGSYTEKIGGHNILEPSSYGVPVICGPYMHSQRDFLDLFREYHVGVQTQKNNITSEILTLLADKGKRERMGQAGKDAINSAKGATHRTWKEMEKLLKS
ncbi:MAG: 3-deoxy-D-manno-octulosonic-acid transferase [Chlamydiales bacterium]|jgi:3-deoxy-D-manno-octulosonic-acid transferase